MTRVTAQPPGRQELREIRVAVFGDGEMTLDEAAEPYARRDLVTAARDLWGAIRCRIEELPDACFARQPDDIDGSDVWSAGQVISHLTEIQIGTLTFWETLAGCELESPGVSMLDAADARLLSRRGALIALEEIERMNRKLFDAIGADAERPAIASHPAFGAAGLKGALLVTCIHLDDHLGQLEELEEAYRG